MPCGYSLEEAAAEGATLLDVPELAGAAEIYALPADALFSPARTSASSTGWSSSRRLPHPERGEPATTRCRRTRSPFALRFTRHSPGPVGHHLRVRDSGGSRASSWNVPLFASAAVLAIAGAVLLVVGIGAFGQASDTRARTARLEHAEPAIEAADPGGDT